MIERKIKRENVVIGPEGTPLTLADLPKPNTVRWVIRRKAEVVAAVRGRIADVGRCFGALRPDSRRIYVLATLD